MPGLDFPPSTVVYSPWRNTVADIKYEEVENSTQVSALIPEGFSLRTFKVPSESEPDTFYYVQVVKNARAGWGNGTPIFLCNCKSGQFRIALCVMGVEKATCKHARNLREVLGS